MKAKERFQRRQLLKHRIPQHGLRKSLGAAPLIKATRAFPAAESFMRNRSIRIILGHLIALMPLNRLRVFLYRALFGYEIIGSSIGWNSPIVVDSARIVDASIGRHNRLIGPMAVRIGKRARIAKGNSFICGWWTAEERFSASRFARRLAIGENTLITSGHYFDVAGAFELGENSWIAGHGSQFWTHGAHVQERDVSIGKDCYIGAAVRFAPGASVGDHNIVALASVVIRPISADHALIAGHPAKVVKEGYDWKTRGKLDG